MSISDLMGGDRAVLEIGKTLSDSGINIDRLEELLNDADKGNGLFRKG